MTLAPCMKLSDMKIRQRYKKIITPTIPEVIKDVRIVLLSKKCKIL
jgi:hypothetical protein